MKNQFSILLLAVIFLVACSNEKKAEETEEPVNGNSSNEWITLFDGNSLDAWRGFKMDHVPSGWRIANGELTSYGESIRDSLNLEHGDVITREQYENFELELEWKISKGSNSGIMYFVQETDSSKHTYDTGPEMQIVDNDIYAEDLKNHYLAGDLYDLIGCSEIAVKAVGEWNVVKIVANGSHVQQWLNGVMVVEYDLNSDKMKNLIEESKWKGYPEFGMFTKGHIALQEHPGEVFYRNIRIRSL